VQPSLDHGTQRADLIHRRIICPESLGPRVSGLVATEMHCRIRDFIYVWLGSVGSCEHEVVSRLDKGHRRNDGLVEIIARGAGVAALHLDAGSVGTEHEDCAVCHCCASSGFKSSLVRDQWVEVDVRLDVVGLLLANPGGYRLRRDFYRGMNHNSHISSCNSEILPEAAMRGTSGPLRMSHRAWSSNRPPSIRPWSNSQHFGRGTVGAGGWRCLCVVA